MKKCRKWFLTTATVLLLLTGVAKVLILFGTARILATRDPLLGVTFGKLLPAVGAAELLLAFACFSGRFTPRLKLSLVAWLATNFLFYRIALWAIGWHHPCSCMGSLAGALHLSDQAADNIMKGVLAYLLVGSYFFLFVEWRNGRTAPEVTT